MNITISTAHKILGEYLIDLRRDLEYGILLNHDLYRKVEGMYGLLTEFIACAGYFQDLPLSKFILKADVKMLLKELESEGYPLITGVSPAVPVFTIGENEALDDFVQELMLKIQKQKPQAPIDNFMHLQTIYLRQSCNKINGMIAKKALSQLNGKIYDRRTVGEFIRDLYFCASGLIQFILTHSGHPDEESLTSRVLQYQVHSLVLKQLCVFGKLNSSQPATDYIVHDPLSKYMDLLDKTYQLNLKSKACASFSERTILNFSSIVRIDAQGELKRRLLSEILSTRTDALITVNKFLNKEPKNQKGADELREVIRACNKIHRNSVKI